MVKVIEDKIEELLFDIPHAAFVFVELAHALVKRGEALPTSASSSRPLGKSIFDAGDAGTSANFNPADGLRYPGNLPVILALQLVTTQKQAQGLTWLLTIQITVIYCNVPELHTIHVLRLSERSVCSRFFFENCWAPHHQVPARPYSYQKLCVEVVKQSWHQNVGGGEVRRCWGQQVAMEPVWWEAQRAAKAEQWRAAMHERRQPMQGPGEGAGREYR